MPFLLSLFLTLSAVMWFFYGLLINDYNVAVSSYPYLFIVIFIFANILMFIYV